MTMLGMSGDEAEKWALALDVLSGRPLAIEEIKLIHDNFGELKTQSLLQERGVRMSFAPDGSVVVAKGDTQAIESDVVSALASLARKLGLSRPEVRDWFARKTVQEITKSR